MNLSAEKKNSNDLSKKEQSIIANYITYFV